MEKKYFIKIMTSLVSFVKNDHMLCVYFCIYKKAIILSLFKIDTLNFTKYILMIFISSLKIYVTGLHNLINKLLK